MGRKTMTCPAGTPTLVDPNVISTIRIQNNDAYPVFVTATADTNPPANPKSDGAVCMRPLDTLPAEGIESLFPDVGVSGYVWLFSAETVQVSLAYV